MIQRKWITAVLAALGAVGVVISTEFGLALQLGSVAMWIAAALVYVFGEWKNDKARFSAQKAKWLDPKFWLTMASAVVMALAQAGVAMPISPEVIILILTTVVGLLFKAKVADVAVDED